MSIEKLNRAARAAGCAMAPPVELFEEQTPKEVAGGWTAAKHEQAAAHPRQQRSSWRDVLTGWTTKAPA